MKIIGNTTTNPAESIFKENRNDRAKSITYFCECDNCPLLENNQCIQLNIMDRRCVYGKTAQALGFTKRASKYSSWIREQKEVHKNLPKLSSAPRKMAFIGDYVYFPYPHWYMISGLPKDLQGNAFSSKHFIPSNMFTVEVLNLILSGRPTAMMGGEIKSYQEEVVPKIIVHLSEVKPLFYYTLIEAYPQYKLEEIDYTGRYAYVNTLKVGSVVKDRKGEGIWDGKQLLFKDYDSIFVPVKGVCTLSIIPSKDATVKITDNSQVDKNTKFKD